MCGIAGMVRFDGVRPDENELSRAAQALKHRGPDDSGIFVKDAAALVHTRLSIIDLASGHQPIFSPDGSVVTVLNGEIYNYRELRDELKRQGHQFQTQSDTEVLVHLYQEYGGLDFLHKLNGMFAFALYDLKRRLMWIARDRTGKKPVYYYRDGDKFVFASELQAIRAFSGLNLSVSPKAIDLYLRYNYVPAPLSIYEQVYKLDAAHFIKVENDQIETTRYWRMPAPSPDTSMSREAFQTTFEEKLRDAVRARLVSDVPLGAFLSGGLDSTAIVSMMCETATERVSTFSVGFGSRSFDESSDAGAVASALGTDHHVEMQASLDVRDIDGILRQFGEPFGDNSAIPTWYLCRMARNNVTVALSGDGADEVLGGYNRYRASQFASRWASLPLRPPIHWVEGLPEGSGYYGDSFVKKLKMLARFIRRLDDNPDNVMPIVMDDSTRARCYSKAFRDSLPAAADPVMDVSRYYASLPLTERMLWTDLESYLADDILVKVDRMSMAHSLELRCPFLDVNLLEFLSTVPLSLKIQGSDTKSMLRRFVGRQFPDVAARSKHGFEAPAAQWLKSDLREQTDDLFNSPWARERFDNAALTSMLDAHRTRKQDLSKPLWALFVLFHWADTHTV